MNEQRTQQEGSTSFQRQPCVQLGNAACFLDAAGFPLPLRRFARRRSTDLDAVRRLVEAVCGGEAMAPSDAGERSILIVSKVTNARRDNGESVLCTTMVQDSQKYQDIDSK